VESNHGRQNIKKATRLQNRRFSIRKKIFGSPERPRLSVFRSDKHIYVQLIDDYSGKTLAAARAPAPTRVAT
jgi:large subunit ribosomal protein L18